MEYRTLPGTDIRISRVCLGTMTFGQQNTEDQARKQLDWAFSQGINFLDTAEMYPVPARGETQGLTEEYVGNWLRTRPRDQVVLATKVAGPNRGMDWIRGGPQLTKAQILQACEDSLRRLKTDYIDLYQLHWPARNVPMFGETYFDPGREYPQAPEIYEQLEALEVLLKAGKVRALGLSNETSWGVMKFKEMARSRGLPAVSTLQNAFNLLNRTYEAGLAEVCFREDVMLLAYSPLAFGILSGKYADNPMAEGRMTLFPGFGKRYHKPQVPEAAAAYRDLARSRGLSPAQLALAWAGSRWYVGAVILGATSLEQLQENVRAFDLALDQETLAEVEFIHRKFTSPAQ